MKRIPETFELNEEDIKKAVAFWLNRGDPDRHDEEDYDIQFSMDRIAKAPPPGAPVGGMGDYSVQQISAKAVKKG